jgi:hypothetical protein
MGNKFDQGIYEVINKQKYIGNKNPTYRSGWERHFMLFLDNNKHILQWASEPIKVPYIHPLTGKGTVYVPDFLINYKNRLDEHRTELIEIKPQAQTTITETMKDRERAVVAINHAKWAAANLFCRKYGLHFRIITEYQLFHMGGQQPRKR